METTIRKIADHLCNCSWIEGIVLGGSRATNMSTENSDIDIGIYYHSAEMDIAEINRIASELDDLHREDLICSEGGWGNWVNCGGWLMIDGHPVDLILRDIQRVEQVIKQTEEGIFTSNYQTGHPHAYIDVMYRGELAVCQVLYAKNDAFFQLKAKAEVYPEKLREALTSFFSFEAEFSCSLAEKSIPQEDIFYMTGHMFRSVCACNQVLFALNREWCINEKKAVFRIDGFSQKPENYSKKVETIFKRIGDDPCFSITRLKELCKEINILCEKNPCDFHRDFNKKE